MARRRLIDVPDDEFREVVAIARSLRDVIRKLHLHDHSNTYNRIRRRIETLGLDTSHFNPWGHRRQRYSEENLREAVAASRSIRQTLLRLGLRGQGGNYRIVRREIERLQIDTSHFSGRGWRRGEHEPVHPRRDLNTLLVENSPACTSGLRRRLLDEGLLEYRCQLCGLNEWRGAPIGLELDHINGVNNDHRLENLRLLCPNCHSQTSTYRGRNRGRYGGSPTPLQLSIL